jgi:hypothetical protein
MLLIQRATKPELLLLTFRLKRLSSLISPLPPGHTHTKSHFHYLDYNWQEAVRPIVAVAIVNIAIEKKLTGGLLRSVY